MCDIKIDLRAAVKWIAPPGADGLNSTLFVIFGPLAADEVCARKTNDAVRMSSNEMTTRCKLAMVYIVDYGREFDI